MKPYRVRCRSDARGEFFVYLGDHGQHYRRLRRRHKKALKSLTLDQMMEIIERMLARHESFLEQHRSLTSAVESDTLPR